MRRSWSWTGEKSKAGSVSWKKELEAVQKDRETQRKRRSRSALPQIALVGYTNAGKSSLMNKMVEVYQKEEDKMVEAKDMLFATAGYNGEKDHAGG